ncbi:MAG TPA: aminoacetone oxidase family FAD-binding enzyme [Clostridiaceae bacterium]|nr:aminoacetone oxidase family FAD-binding enzyme [Clostridiaceae bacterium]
MAGIYDLVVVGGGASGLVAAISAAQSNDKLKILILEAQDQPGRKILASGNGRCNLSHLNVSSDNYQGNIFTRSLLAKFSAETLQYFFDALGLYTMVDDEGRMYPLSNQALTVLTILKEAIEKNNIATRTDSPVIRISLLNNSWNLTLLSGEVIRSRRVVLATGGLAAPQLGGSRSGYLLASALGLVVVPVVPALTPLVLAEKLMCQQLKGLRFRAVSRLLHKGNYDGSEGNNGTEDSVASQTEILSEPPNNWQTVRISEGEFLFADYGLSGIAAMELSEAVASHCFIDGSEGPALPIKRAKLRPVEDWYALPEEKEFILKLDLLPDYSDRELESRLWQRLSSLSVDNRDRLLVGMLPLALAEYLGQEAVRKVVSVFEDKQKSELSGQSLIMSDLAGNVLQSDSERHVRKKVDSGSSIRGQNLDDACLISTTISTLKSWDLNVVGVRGFEQAQASLGGLETSAVNPRTMEVYDLPGLHVTGELLDVLGDTGGYNLHFAFASGIAAGEAAAAKLTAGE